MQPNTVIGLKSERSLSLAKDVQVTVRSWLSKDGRAFDKKAGKSPTTASSVKGSKASSVQSYLVIRPNISEAAAQNLANKLQMEISQHERLLSWEAPGDLTLTPRTPVVLQGCGAGWDDTYAIDCIDRHMSFEGGLKVDVRAKNHVVSSQVVV